MGSTGDKLTVPIKYQSKGDNMSDSDYEDLTSGRDAGARICVLSTHKLGFFGATPVVQQDAPAATVTAGSTTTVANTAVAEIQVALKALGLMAT